MEKPKKMREKKILTVVEGNTVQETEETFQKSQIMFLREIQEDIKGSKQDLGGHEKEQSVYK